MGQHPERSNILSMPFYASSGLSYYPESIDQINNWPQVNHPINHLLWPVMGL